MHHSSTTIHPTLPSKVDCIPSPERNKRWAWTVAPLKGTLDEENEKVILDTRKALLAMKLSDKKIIKELNKLFGVDKVESALNGA